MKRRVCHYCERATHIVAEGGMCPTCGKTTGWTHKWIKGLVLTGYSLFVIGTTTYLTLTFLGVI